MVLTNRSANALQLGLFGALVREYRELVDNESMSSFKRSQAKYVKQKYRVRNWPEYEAGLRKRGSLTVWICEEELGSWEPSKTANKRRGGQQKYSNVAIETALTIGMVFHLPLRQTEGFLGSLFALLGSSAPVPDHTTISRRAAKLGKVSFVASDNNAAIHILVDSSGLRVHTGSMRKPPTARDWRKLHLAIDAKTGEVVACEVTRKQAKDASRVAALLSQVDTPLVSLSADAAYDERPVYQAADNHQTKRSPRVLIPPKRNAKLGPTSDANKERNRNIRARSRIGKRRWGAESGYNRRSLIENTFSRYKRIIGPTMRSRRLATQRVEARIGVKILNRMTALGMPDGYMTA